MTHFRFSARSLKALDGVHPDLVQVAFTALTRSRVDFVVLQGRRTPAEQARLLAAGATTTLESRHLTGHAIDVGAYLGIVRFDAGLYYPIARAFQGASIVLGVPVRWGGSWDLLSASFNPEQAVQRYASRKRANGQKPLIDLGHFELLKARYPF